VSQQTKTEATPDTWVPDPQVFREMDITPMTGSRWDKDPRMIELGWPPPMQVRKRNYRSRKMLERFKANMLERAMKARKQLLAQTTKTGRYRRRSKSDSGR
jgi:hypothetical protein